MKPPFSVWLLLPLHIPPLLVPPALVVLTAPDEAPFLCLAPPAPPPPALGDEVVLGLPAPTFVALAAGPGIVVLQSYVYLKLSYNKSGSVVLSVSLLQHLWHLQLDL